jgi:squalene-associated FAD-dependent desaturase
MKPRIAVVGGGLAGVTAALACADAGCEVTLLEGRPRLGGLAGSFDRESDAGGLAVDTGQHVFLRCCTAYLAFLDRLGVRDQVHLQDRLDIPVRSPGRARPVRLRRGGGPAPLHLAGALARFSVLSPLDRARAARGALALRRVDRDSPATDRESFGGWLAAHGQNDRTVDALWDLFGRAALNATADEASLALAATVFQDGLLTDPRAADIGWALVPLGDLHASAPLRALSEAGAEVRTSARVRGLSGAGHGWQVVVGGVGRAEPETLTVDGVVLAVPPPAAEALLPTGALPAAPGWADRLGAAPIVNVHAVFDRRVLDEPFVAGVGTPVQWVFDRSRQSGLASGQYLAVSLSAAAQWIDRPSAEVLGEILPALRALLPRAQDAVVRDAFVTRERTATFAPRPGSAALRPGPRTSAPALALAGAWTATGWPATMEGAVRSGNAAARTLLADLAGRPVGEGAAA